VQSVLTSETASKATVEGRGIADASYRHVRGSALTWGVVLLAIFSCCTCSEAQLTEHPLNDDQRLRAILDYISSGWNMLTRSATTCTAVADNKFIEPSLLYLPKDLSGSSALAKFAEDCNIRLERLPFIINGPGQVTGNGIRPPGLLFLQNPYVVPGGRFNEMYGWDSYFIIRGLLREGKIDLARGMVENFFFEIEHYGAVLNANRTYYLTRSQPPFLSSMIMAVYEASQVRGQANRTWLAKAYYYAKRDYQMWVRDPHLAGTTGLSRYYDFGEGPVPEGLHDETGYYHDVLAYFLRENRQSPYLVASDTADSLPPPEYSLELCQDRTHSAANMKCDLLEHVALSSEYYKGDRSMRESGFDISFRFGPYGAETHHFAPVCLNSLLYKTEEDMAKMSSWLGNEQEAIQWRRRAQERQKLVQALLWNRQAALFLDYNFRTRQQSSYAYATTFYPLWVGIATTAQARAVVNNLHLFEYQGGLAMSTKDTGVQWDYPYGWAPIQLLAVEGLRRYGYKADADRISSKFLAMVLANFERDGNIREKYNVVTDSSNIELREGYRGNIIGFGWTNGVFLDLLRELPAERLSRLLGRQPGR
jgi:alpha,alpha-trehalase